jgi:hypothetical protein
MTDLFYILVLVVDILAIRDIMRKLQGDVSRFLWIVCVLFLPL